MQASQKKISGILTEQITYQIPPYQRPYSWETENVEALLEDLWEAFIRSDDEYFIGSLITARVENNESYEVIDGQQRLTTLNLIFAALRDCIHDVNAKKQIEDRIFPKDALALNNAGKPRLLLRRSDQEFFLKHVLQNEPITTKRLDSPKEKLKDNLDLIKKFLGTNKSEADMKLFAGYILNHVYVVHVIADSRASAHRLFNVLNSTGVPLSNADLIKNHLFTKLRETDDSEQLEAKWLELEQEVGLENLDIFLEQYRSSKTHEKASKALAIEFEVIINNTDVSPCEFLDSLIAAAEIYSKIKESSFKDPGSLRSVKSLNRVGFNEWIAPLMLFCAKQAEQTYSNYENDFIFLLEKITYQNWIRRLGRTARLTVYHQLIKAINDNKNFDELHSIFIENSNNQEFNQFINGEIYGKPFAQALLIRLDEAEEDSSVTREYKGRLSIEHILPKSLKHNYWKERFSEELHGIVLNKIGNLAMLSGVKNSKAQNYDFLQKKKIYSERQNNVSFTLTKEIIAIEDWNHEAINQRQERLTSIAENLWTIN